MIARNGVIASSTSHYDGTYLLTPEGVARLPELACTPERLLDAAERYRLDALWVLPGSVESWHAGCGVGDRYYEALTHSSPTAVVRPQTSEGVISCVHVQRAPTGRDRHALRVFFPEHDERWGGLHTVTNPRALLATINLLENGLSVYLDYSPGSTGKYIMKYLNRGSRASWLAPIDFTGTPWLPTDEQIMNGDSVPLSGPGTRLLPPTLSLHDMTAPLFFHAYDKAYGFGGAMAGVSVGEGAPLHLAGSPGRWDAKVPGIWRLGNGKWLYTPEVNYAIVEGYLEPGQLTEAYAWPTYHQTMRSFADLFWTFDEMAKEKDPVARGVAKQIRSIGFGWLAMDVRQFRADGSGSPGDLYRPDIWGMVVSDMRIKMNYEMNRLWTLGYEPVWWNCDELGFFSNDPDPRSAVPIITRTGKGAFRHRYTLRVTDAILLAFLEHREDQAVAFAQCHDLLLSTWEEQKAAQGHTLLVPAVAQHA